MEVEELAPKLMQGSPAERDVVGLERERGDEEQSGGFRIYFAVDWIRG